MTFLDYVDSVSEQIMTRLDEKKKELATTSSAKPHEHAEDIHTDIFLSHKRATAQGKS